MIPLAQFSGLPPAHRRVSPATQNSVIPSWSTREQWLIGCNLTALSASGVAHRRRLGGLSVHAFMTVMRADAATADHRTGQGVFTSHQTVARVTGLPYSIVKRARQAAEHLGLTVTTDPGRYLSKDERLDSAAATGRTYWRKASTRVLTVSRTLAALVTDQLPRRGSKTPISPKRVKPKRSRVSAANESKIPMSIRKLAAGLQRDLFWLKNYGHINRLCRLLLDSPKNLETWTTSGLVRALNDAATNRGWKTISTPAKPLGYLRYLLSLIDPAQSPLTAQEAIKGRMDAARSTESARRRLEYLKSDEHRERVAAGVALCRSAMRRTIKSQAIRT